MKEADIINDAYASSLKISYAAFAEAFIAANGNQGLQQEAEKSFASALKNAKDVKARALAVMLGI